MGRSLLHQMELEMKEHLRDQKEEMERLVDRGAGDAVEAPIVLSSGVELSMPPESESESANGSQAKSQTSSDSSSATKS